MKPGELEHIVTENEQGGFTVHAHGISLEGNELSYRYDVDSRLLTPEDTAELRRMCEQTEELHRRAKRLSEDVLDPDRNEKLDRVLDELSVARDRLSDMLTVITVAQAEPESP